MCGYSFCLAMVIAGMSLFFDAPLVVSRVTGENMEIDGRLNENAWNGAQKLFLKDNRSGEDVEDPSFSSYVLVCHDEAHLYIAFVNQDRNIWATFENRDDFLWEEEVVEVFIDTDEQPSTYIELEVSPKNVLFDSFITDTLNIDLVETPKFTLSGWLTAVSVDGTVGDTTDVDRSWVVEMALPFESMIADYVPEKLNTYRWKINFYRIDRDADGPNSYAWSTTSRRFHAPSKFGILQFD
jgi:hypothetical protein